MDGRAANGAAFNETVVFLNHFSDLHDPRQPGKVSYPLDEVLLLCLLAVLAGAKCFTEIALFGVKKLDLLRRFRPFKDGTPAHDHLGDILASLDAEQFQLCFVAWVAAVTGVPAGVIAIDGKTARRSGKKGNAKASVHMVSAFAARQRLVLGQVKVAERPMRSSQSQSCSTCWAIEGAIVTIDAMGCQRDIAQKIIGKKGPLTQRYVKRHAITGKALKSAVFAEFRSPIFILRLAGDFWERLSDGTPAPPDRPHCCVPQTLELGTTACRTGTLGKTQKSTFLNCVPKLVFRFEPARWFREQVRSPPARLSSA